MTLYSHQNQGVLVGNNPADFTAFNAWAPQTNANMATLALNQSNLNAWMDSAPYIVQQAKGFMAAGANVCWTLAAPGPRQLENIVLGGLNAQYRNVFAQILAASTGNAPILVRLYHEFNLGAGNPEVAAQDCNGTWNGPLFIKAFQYIVSLGRTISKRFRFEWCPNARRNGISPDLCYPGDDFVDYIGIDSYLDASWMTPGCWNVLLNCAYGMGWIDKFARDHGKLMTIPEYGCSSDALAADFDQYCQWIKANDNLYYHSYWDRSDGSVACKISDGSKPKTAAAYRKAFG